MREQTIKDLIDVVHYIGQRPDYIQGGGGNISIKETDVMFIKASGFRFDELRTDVGLVAVDHHKIKDSYNVLNTNVEDTTEIDALMNNIVRESIVEHANTGTLRPSMEIGFHALLECAVIHTHSVYANVLNCAMEGPAFVAELFPTALFIPYAMPGVPLTIAIKEQGGTKTPNILFLENHGLIVVGETPSQAYALHEEVNRRIRERLPQIPIYPDIVLLETENGFRSDSGFIKKFIVENPALADAFTDTILFPDQAVYGQALQNGSIALDIDSGTITYITNRKEALAFEETFAAWAFILENISACGLTQKTISEAECSRLIALDSEKYRTSLAKKS